MGKSGSAGSFWGGFITFDGRPISQNRQVRLCVLVLVFPLIGLGLWQASGHGNSLVF